MNLKPTNAANNPDDVLSAPVILDGAETVQYTGNPQKIVTELPAGMRYAISTEYVDPKTIDTSKIVPAGYTALDYLEGTGTQYIVTGCPTSGNTRVVIDAKFNNLDVQQRLFGATRGDVFYYEFYINGGEHFAYEYNDNGPNDVNTGVEANTERHLFDMNGVAKTLQIDNGKTYSGDLQHTGAANNSNSTSLSIWALARNDRGIGANANANVYSCLIYEKGALKRDFVPVRKNDGTLGMYDLVENKLYTNEGTDDFIAGEEVNITLKGKDWVWADNINDPINNIVLNANTKYYVYYYTANSDTTMVDSTLSVKEFYVNCTDHVYGAWQTTPASFTENGEKYRVCQGCGHRESEIIPAANAVNMAQGGSYTYTGTAIVPEITVMAGETVLQENVDYQLNFYNNLEVGTASYRLSGIKDYQGATYTGNFTIVPQEITRPAADANNYVYNGEPQTYQIATDDAYSITGGLTKTDAGQYNVYVSLKDTRNYVWDNQTTGNLTYTFTINPQVVEFPAVQNVDLDANDTLSIADYYVSDYYIVKTIRNKDVTDTKDYLDETIQSGEYRVTLGLNNNQNYVWQNGTHNDVTVDFTINVTYQDNELYGTVAIDDWTYGEAVQTPDGVSARYGTPIYYYTTDLSKVNAANSAREENRAIKITDWVAWYANVPHQAGTYYVIAYVPATDPQHLPVHSEAATLTISQKVVSVGDVFMAAKIFDGTTNGSGRITLNGVLAGDVVRADGVFAWADSAAGTKNYTVNEIVLDNANYILDSNTYQGEDDDGILWRVVMKPAADIRSFVYNGRAQIYDLPRSNFYTASNTEQINAGTYTVTVSLNDELNYRWNDDTQTAITFPFVINRVDLDTTVSMDDFFVDEEPTTPVVNATLNGVAVQGLPFVLTYTKLGETEDMTDMPTEIGTYRVTASLTDHMNFNDVSVINYFQINQLVLASDGMGSLVIAEDGSYGLTLTAGALSVGDEVSSVNYAMKITCDDVVVGAVENVTLKILIPPALQDLARQDEVVAFDLLQKNLKITLSNNGNVQKVSQYTLEPKDGQVYAVFGYSGAGQADIDFAYSVAREKDDTSNITLIIVCVACGVAATVAVVTAIVLIKKHNRKKLLRTKKTN